MSDSNGSLRSEGYHVQRLDDVLARVSYIEGRLEALATKEDVANAKYALLVAYISIGISVLVAVGAIVMRIWLG
ncbi:MAG: hypothetical protein OXM03_01585 [Chloroflexota bacterium]|nr:hypothetical protein [Chloroflexota bacterium]MDE2839298.1 hypothetical protein [Chloroflexota bacterium]MDE2930414.1 hypothetical protein [Chloroflexota bacterium]